MAKITNPSELQERFSRCGKCLEKKFNCEPGHKAIVICGGTGCLSANSQEILDRLHALIKEHGLEDKVTANLVGCFGFCSEGPFVKVFPEETLYTKVQVKDVDEWVIAGWMNKGSVMDGWINGWMGGLNDG